MEKTAIIGGGASGMTCAVLLSRAGKRVTLYERGARLGRKLAATGNGQGNVTNVRMGAEHYFSDDQNKVADILARFGADRTIAFLESMGGIFLPDSRGRVYPASRQASAVTDLFRRELERSGAEVRLSSPVVSVSRNLEVITEHGKDKYDRVILAAGGKAAPNFGTDGGAYAIARAFGHTVTDLKPALVQLRTSPKEVRGLKGIRADARLVVLRGTRTAFEGRGDVLFTESGLSGDVVFRASSYAREGDVLSVDFLPDVPSERLRGLKTADDLLCVVNNGLARALDKRMRESGVPLSSLVKGLTFVVTGTLGFEYAQVTKGGIPLGETDDALMSRKRENLYFAGEIVNVDGECGGYNLQWAFASAAAVTEGICRRLN